MSKRHKKLVRRRRRREKRKKQAAASWPLDVQAEGVPSEITIEAEAPVAIEAAESADEESPKPPTFTMTAYSGGRMRPRFFAQDVVVDLAGLSVQARNRPILLGHDPSKIVGHTTDITVDGRITAEGIVSGTGLAAQEVISNSRNGFPWRASIGASVEKMVRVEDGETVEVNGRSFRGPILVARKATLGEISFVPLAGDNKTTAKVAAASGSQTVEVYSMKFQAWVEAQGFVFDDLTDQQRKALRAAYDAEQDVSSGGTVTEDHTWTAQAQQDLTSDQGGLDIEAQREEVAAETERINAIRRLCAEHESPTIEVDGSDVDLAAHAIRQNWSRNDTELHIIRNNRPAAPGIHSRSHGDDCTIQAMQGAMMLSAGVPLDAPELRSMQAYAMGLPRWTQQDINSDDRQRYMEAAHRFSDMSALDICAEAIRLDGRQVPRGRHSVIQAAFSGSALTNVFTTSVNAVLLTTYMQAMDTTMGWVQEADVADFKTNERIRMAKGSDLEQLPRGKEADHYDRSDVQESYKVHRYAKQFVVDEQDVIDDALNALRETPREMGQAAARLRPDLVYAILLANGALDADSTALFDSSSHSNTQTSAALNHANLVTAIALIENQQDNGVNLNLRASHLIVPADLKHTAAELINSSQILYGADDESVRGNANTIALIENLRLVSDSRLSNGVTDPATGTTHSGSATTWYLASNTGHTIEVGYLRGTGRAPTVRSFSLSQGKWGIGWDIKMDIGAKALDYRALARSEA